MQIAQESSATSPVVGVSVADSSGAVRTAWADYKIIRRNGAVVGFEPAKIAVAMTKAYLAVNGSQGAASARIRELVARLTDQVVGALQRRQPQGGTFHIEDIQDQVELALMRSGEHDVARAYVLYREERSRARARGEERAPVRGRARCTWWTTARGGCSTGTACAACSSRPATGWKARPIPPRSSRRRCATCTTACRWRRCASRRSSRRARRSRRTRPTATSPRACCSTPSASKCWARKSARRRWRRATRPTFPNSSAAASTPSCSTPSWRSSTWRASAGR